MDFWSNSFPVCYPLHCMKFNTKFIVRTLYSNTIQGKKQLTEKDGTPTFSYNAIHQDQRLFSGFTLNIFKRNRLEMDVRRKVAIFVQANSKPFIYGSVCINNLSTLFFTRSGCSQIHISLKLRLQCLWNRGRPSHILGMPLVWRNVSHQIYRKRM